MTIEEMNRDDIIAMAREARIGDTGMRGDFIFFQPGTEGLERFAALVAAAEREACAQICDTESANESSFWEKGGWVHACGNCAAAIRARGEK